MTDYRITAADLDALRELLVRSRRNVLASDLLDVFDDLNHALKLLEGLQANTLPTVTLTLYKDLLPDGVTPEEVMLAACLEVQYPDGPRGVLDFAHDPDAPRRMSNAEFDALGAEWREYHRTHARPVQDDD